MGNALDCEFGHRDEPVLELPSVDNSLSNTECTVISKSNLWLLQKDIYNNKGVEIWEKGMINNEITTNCFVAQKLSRILFAFITDVQSQESYNSNEKIYIIEAGGGSGQLCHNILNELIKYEYKMNDNNQFPFVYIFTEISYNLLAYLINFPQLRKFRDLGILDFALWDSEKDIDITLFESKIVINPDHPSVYPIYYIFMDIISHLTHSAYYIRDGDIYPIYVKIMGNNDKKDFNIHVELLCPINDNTKEYSETIDMDCVPIVSESLLLYRGFLNTTTTFPIGFYQCIKNIKNLSNGFGLYIADNGYIDGSNMENIEDILFYNNLSYGISVNFEFINSLFLKWNSFIITSKYNDGYKTSSYLYLCNNFKRTQYEMHLSNQFTLDDYYQLQKGIRNETLCRMNLFKLLLILSNYDNILFSKYKEYYVPDQFINANIDTDVTLLHTHNYSIQKSNNILPILALIFMEKKLFQQAIDYFLQSSENGSLDIKDYYNIALCYYFVLDYEEAIKYFNLCIKNNIHVGKSKIFRDKIEYDMSQQHKNDNYTKSNNNSQIENNREQFSNRSISNDSPVYQD